MCEKGSLKSEGVLEFRCFMLKLYSGETPACLANSFEHQLATSTIFIAWTVLIPD